MTACVSCPGEIPENARFCPHCGAPVVSSSQAVTYVDSHREDRTPARGSASTSTPSRSLSGGLPSGTLLGGRYRIVALLGKGGMGEVYRAEDLRLEQLVALKFLPDSIARDEKARARLHAEVRLARQATHPNVCRVHDVVELEGRLFLSMEYVDGEDLASLLRRIGRLSGTKALDIARQLGAGLLAAHKKGVIHRDLKPANVMLDGRGQVLITDFGLAVTEGLGEGELAGTPAYMAPEQLAGQAATPLSDIFAYGLILYELWTGKRAFPAGTLAQIRESRSHTTPDPPSSQGADLGDAEERVILRCLQSDPTRRPQSVGAVLAALPGGDPLAAALAAGETPSPELVAAAGEEGTLSIGKALALVGGLLGVLALIVLLSQWGSMMGLLPAVKSAQAMESKAVEILSRFSPHGTTVDEEIGFSVSLYEINRLRREASGSPDLYRRLRTSWRTVRFWYRRSPQWIESPLLDWVGQNDPAPYYAGEASIQLDARGRLLSLRLVPAETRPPVAVDAAPLLLAAGLDPPTLDPTTPTRILNAGTSDTHLAWKGALDGVPILAEATFWKGHPVGFRTLSPDEPFVRVTPYRPPAAGEVARWLLVLAGVSVAAFLLVLAHRNLRLGRGDQRGSMRLLMAVLLIQLATLALNARYVPTLYTMRFKTVYGISACVGIAMLARLAYLAVEPPLRRRFPRLLVSWTRLLSGEPRDPLVGRDVLAGLFAGAVVMLLTILISALPAWLEITGVDPVSRNLSLFVRSRWAASWAVENFWFAFMRAFVTVGSLLIGRLVLRGDRLAWICPFLLLALFQIEGRNLAIELALGATVAAVYLLTLHLAGLLGLCAAFFGSVTLSLGITVTADRFTSDASIAFLAILVAFALAAARVAIGRRPLFSAGALDA